MSCCGKRWPEAPFRAPSRPLLDQPLSDAVSPLRLVRGYVAERRGDVREAEREDKERRITCADEGRARLGLLALDGGNNELAASIARASSSRDDAERPSSSSALGERRGDVAASRYAEGFFPRAARVASPTRWTDVGLCQRFRAEPRWTSRLGSLGLPWVFARARWTSRTGFYT
jgi:hypothetical protein